MKKFAAGIFSLIMLASATASRADESSVVGGYAVPTYKELIQTVIVLGGLDINNSQVADEYGRLIYCDLFTSHYANDFEWNNLRSQMISRVIEKRELYRIQYEMKGIVKLGRYDFQKQVFPLSEDTAMRNVGRLNLLPSDEYKQVELCRTPLKVGTKPVVPLNVFLIFNQPLTLEEIKIPMDEAEAILIRLKEMRVADRSLYMRMRFRIIDIPRIAKNNMGDNTRAELKGQLRQMDFYLDEEMTQWVASVPVQYL